MSLEQKGILCLHNTGYTMSDGHSDAAEELDEYPEGTFWGYCFYHMQDIESAMSGNGLMLAFDYVENEQDKVKVGKVLKEELEKEGFSIEWDGIANQRINIVVFDWKKRNLSL